MRVWEPYVTGGRLSPEDLKVPWCGKEPGPGCKLVDCLIISRIFPRVLIP